jgi:superfamily II DNA or RNA helicase
MELEKIEKWLNTIYVNINECYNIEKYCKLGYSCEFLVKIGSTKYLPSRYYNYITYNPIKTDILVYYYIIDYDCYKLDNDIKNDLNDYRIHDTGGTEYYKNTVLDKLELYFEARKIKFIKYTDITDFPKLTLANKKAFEYEFRNDQDKKNAYLEELYEIKHLKPKYNITKKKIQFELGNELNEHQIDILNKTCKYFEDNDNGILNLFCRYGKTRLSSIFARNQKYNNIIILVPSLYLVEQTYKTWIVYFDRSIIKKISSQDFSDLNTIKQFYYDSKQNNKQVIFITTYHSSYKFKDLYFDLCIYDEAHRTTGEMSTFNVLLNAKNIKKKLFLTATMKYYDYNDSDSYNHNMELKINSMDDNDIYGNVIASVSAKKALELKRICPYYIMTMKLQNINEINSLNCKEINYKLDNASNKFINDFRDSISKKNTVTNTDENITENIILQYLNDNRQRYIRIAYGLLSTMLEKNIKHVITFHKYVKGSELFKTILETFIILGYFNKQLIEEIQYHIESVDGSMNKESRKELITNFQDDNYKTILCSAKVLQEGVDIPNCDCTCFVDLKTSVADSIQSLSRCMTYIENKKSYVIIPFDSTDFELDLQNIITGQSNYIKVSTYASDFRLLLRNIMEIDDNIKEYFRNYLALQKPEIFNINNNEITEGIDIYEKCLIDLNIIDNVIDLAYEVFGIAKQKIKGKYVNELEYKKHVENDFNGDLPQNADKIYRTSGWHGWNDYLGIDPYMPLLQIRKYMYRINKLLADEGKKMIENKMDYKKYAKDNGMMVNVEPIDNNWCWLLLPNYDELVEQYYKTKYEIILAIKKLNIKTIDDYEKKYKLDTHLAPYKYLNNGFYNKDIPMIEQNISTFINSIYNNNNNDDINDNINDSITNDNDSYYMF